MVLRITATYPELNAVFDEGYHIAAGLQAYQLGRFTTGAEQPPLSRWAISLLPQLEGVEYRSVTHRASRPEELPQFLTRSVLEEQREYWRTLTLARMGGLVFLPILIYSVYRWSTELYGLWAGWAACALVAFSPNLTAHAGLATSDFAVAALLSASAYAAWLWSRAPTRRQAIVAGCLAGLAIGGKYSALVFLPAIVGSCFLLVQGKAWLHGDSWNRSSIRTAVGQLALFGVFSFLLLWACFGFETRPLRDASRRPYEALDAIVAPDSTSSSALYWAAETIPVPLQDFATGVSWLSQHAQKGHEAFLLGEVATSGWWHYFPVVLAFKTPWPFLVLIAGAVVVVTRHRTLSITRFAPLAAAAGILLVSMGSPINIGVRHILPVCPLLAVFASGWFVRSDRLGKGVWLRAILGIALLVGNAAESLRSHPHYLSYFNLFAQGREHQVLGDSNLDWGQDLYRLSRYVKKERIENLSLRYFGTTSPETMGLPSTRRFGSQDRPRGWVASSVTHLQGIYQPRSAWLEGREPHAKIGRSIWLFYIEVAPDAAGGTQGG